MFFDVGALLVRAELLGTATVLANSPLQFVLRIPASDDEFHFAKNDTWRIHAFGSPGGGAGVSTTALYPQIRFGPMSIDSEPKARTVAVVALDVALPEAQPLVGVDSASESQLERKAYEQAARAATVEGTRLVEETIAWVRVRTAQHWLPATEERVTLLRPVILLGEGGEVRHDAMCHAGGGTIVMLGADNALDASELVRVAARVQAGDRAPHPEQLVQDARYYAAFGSDADCARATLFAAMACETKIKVELSLKATPTNLPLVEVVLDHRSLPVSVHELFDRPAKAVFGASLKDDDKTLFTAVQKLFEARNAFVHRLTIPSREAARSHVEAAVSVLAWISSAEKGGSDAGEANIG
ncbi:MAG TPA: hypothetical protein VMZ22_07665 [Acidimicrobiales bacterium]|nr:hypothetical protein [Acidimicrobiales bacterium]